MTAAMARTRVPRCPRPDPTPETTALNPPFPRLALAALICVPVAAHAELIDYAQVDTSSSATTAVLVGAVGSGDAATPAPIVSATFTRWDTGEAASLGYTHRWSLTGDPHRWIVGAGVGANSFHNRSSGGDPSKVAPSARVQSEWLGPAPGGNYYALAQASSFRGSWLGAAQYSPSALPVAAEWTRYHERSYQSTSLGVRISIGVPRWFVRVGATHANAETRPYIGIAYNAF